MDLKVNLLQTLDDMESVVNLFRAEPFDIYFLGGAACLLGGYTSRATLDFDFIDQNYMANMGRIFAVLRDYDMLEYENTILAPDYKERAKKLEQYKSFHAYVLAPEDIVVSKIIRLQPKDLEDIDDLIPLCEKQQIRDIINAVLAREDLYKSKKKAFAANLPKFREQYNV